MLWWFTVEGRGKGKERKADASQGLIPCSASLPVWQSHVSQAESVIHGGELCFFDTIFHFFKKVPFYIYIYVSSDLGVVASEEAATASLYCDVGWRT